MRIPSIGNYNSDQSRGWIRISSQVANAFPVGSGDCNVNLNIGHSSEEGEMNIKKEGTDLIKVIPSIPDEGTPTRLEYCGRFDSLLRAAIAKGCNDEDDEEEKTLNDLLREGDDLNLLNRGIVEVMD